MTLRIQIIREPKERVIPEDVWVVNKLTELVRLNDLLIRAQDPSGPDEELWLTDPSLEQYIPRPTSGMIEIMDSEDPMTALAAAYGSLPSLLTTDLARRLLRTPHPSGITVTQLLLARAINVPEMENPSSTVRPTHVLESVVRASHAMTEPLVREAWKFHGPSLAVGNDTLPGPARDPDFVPALLAARLLAGYPKETRLQVLDSAKWSLPYNRRTEDAVSALDIPDPRVLGPERLASLSVLLRPTLEKLSMDSYLDTISGRLTVELDVLLERLELESTSVPPVYEIRQCFSWMCEVDADCKSRLNRYADVQAVAAGLTPPASLAQSAEDVQFELQEWQTFFTERFLPAVWAWRRQGRPRQGRLVDALVGADSAFAHWIRSAFPYLKSLPTPPLAYRQVRNMVNSGPSIVVLIDGLAFEMTEIMQEEGLRAGIRFANTRPCLASLPTITAVGMFTAVSGLPADVACSDEVWNKDENLRFHREEVLRKREPEAVVSVVWQLDQVNKALALPSHLYVLVWTEVDRALHRYDDTEQFVDHAKISLRHLFRSIAQEVEHQPHLRELKDKLRVVVTADHGWTDVLLPDPTDRPPINDASAHHRLYEVPRDLSEEEIEQVNNEWIVIAGSRYSLPAGRSFLVPPGNHLVRRGVTRAHGGLSQGEVFVPLAVGRFVSEAFRGVSITAFKDAPLQNSQKGEIKLVVNNPNNNRVQEVRFRCRDLDFRAELDSLNPLNSRTLGPFPVLPSRSGHIDEMEITLRYEGVLIGPEQVKLEAPLFVERSSEERLTADYSKLEDLFDDLR